MSLFETKWWILNEILNFQDDDDDENEIFFFYAVERKRNFEIDDQWFEFLRWLFDEEKKKNVVAIRFDFVNFGDSDSTIFMMSVVRIFADCAFEMNFWNQTNVFFVFYVFAFVVFFDDETLIF